MIKNRISLFAVTLLVVGFLFLALPEMGYSQPPIGCCQYELSCAILFEGDQAPCSNSGGEIELGATCDHESGVCIGMEPVSRIVPTLSEWGLMAMAGILGLVGFMVIRRRKLNA
jgi:hypothetical protein